MPLLVRIRTVRPGIGSVRLGMAVQIEDLDYAIPDRIALIDLFYGDALDMRRGHAMQLVNRGPTLYIITV